VAQELAGMRVLFVTIERPYPPVAGPELRDWQNVAAAIGAGQVGVAYLTAEADADHPPPGLALWRRLDRRGPKEIWGAGGATPIDVALSPAALAGLDACVAEFAPAVVVLEHTQLHALVPRLKAAGVRLVVDMHNIESHLYACLVPPRLPLKWLERRLFDRGAAHIRGVERQLLRAADQVWLCSEADRHRLAALGPASAELFVVPNGLPPGRYRATRPRAAPPSQGGGRPSLLFLGQLGYPPNVQAVRYLARRIAPLLARARPDAEIVVAGRAPSRKLTELLRAAPNLRLVPDPPDVAPLLQAADLMLVPLFKGSGTRLKLVEAWAAGLPVVATPKAAEGLAAEDGRELLLAHRAPALVRAALRALEDRALYARLSAGGLARVERELAPERLAPLVQGLLRRLAPA
jgi:glycosyltransferase involved in cell wall biosynthesis